MPNSQDRAVLSVGRRHCSACSPSDRLIARCGPFTTTVSLEAIEAIPPSRSPLASPACSLDRLHIRHRGSSSGLLVSPIDKRAFLEGLVTRCPNLVPEGDTVVQKAP